MRKAAPVAGLAKQGHPIRLASVAEPSAATAEPAPTPAVPLAEDEQRLFGWEGALEHRRGVSRYRREVVGVARLLEVGSLGGVAQSGAAPLRSRCVRAAMRWV